MGMMISTDVQDQNVHAKGLSWKEVYFTNDPFSRLSAGPNGDYLQSWRASEFCVASRQPWPQAIDFLEETPS